MAGYSREAIKANYRVLVNAGLPEKRAISEAISAARVMYFQKHPHGALPGYLQFPKGRRLREHYDRYGKPIAELRRENPIDNAGTLRVNMRDMKKWRVYSDNVKFYNNIVKNDGVFIPLDSRPYVDLLTEYGINFTLSGAYKKNPQRRKKLRVTAEVQRAANLYHDFTGHTDLKAVKMTIPPLPKSALAFGHCDGVMYSTVRDGKAEKYIHRFAKDSRPLLCSSPDGKQLYMLGGAYDFTERGIVDKKIRRK